MAQAERIERGYLGTLLRFTLLAPDLVESILNGRQPEGVTLPQLLQSFPTGCLGQCTILKRATSYIQNLPGQFAT
jgi:hypothetical protein